MKRITTPKVLALVSGIVRCLVPVACRRFFGYVLPLQLMVSLPARPTSRASRRWLGVAVVLLVVLLQAATELLAGHTRPRVLLRLGVAALQMPLLMLALSASFEWAKRRRLGSIPTLVTGATIAGVLGVLVRAPLLEGRRRLSRVPPTP